MSSLTFGFLIVVFSFRQVAGTAGKELLPPPQNVTVWSKDFSLFLTWLPPGVDSTQMSYTVEWMDPFDLEWNHVPFCTDISETVCDITCVPSDLYNRYSVQVKAQTRTATGISSSAWVEVENIDYGVQVEPGPPDLQMEMTGDILQVKTLFRRPSCMDALSQYLTSEVEFWAEGSKKKVNFSGPMDIDTSQFGSGTYCFQARTLFSLTEKRSRFSEPECRVFHEKGNWESVALPLLLLLILPAGSFTAFRWYRTMPKGVKTLHILDFSSYKGPERLLEYSERDIIQVDFLICTEIPVQPGKRSRSGHQVCASTASVHSTSEDEDEDDDEDSSSIIPYTERLRFQKESASGSMVSMIRNQFESSSASGSSQERNGCLPDFTVLEHPLLTDPVLKKDMSKLQGRTRDSLSENSSTEETLGFSVCSPAAGGDGQDVVGVNIDSFLQLFGNHLIDSGGYFEDGCGNLHGSQISLLGIQDQQEPHGLILEEVFTDRRNSEYISRSCGTFMVEIPLLTESAVGSLENELQERSEGLKLDSTPETKLHGYISRA